MATVLAIVDIIALIAVPIIAVWVGQVLQNRAAKRKDKIAIFQCLMTHRATGWAHQDTVNALNIIDIVFDSCSFRVTGIVVPSEKSFFNFFKSNPDIFIPFNRIRKIGRDVILVELNPVTAQQQVSTTSSEEIIENINTTKESVDEKEMVE